MEQLARALVISAIILGGAHVLRAYYVADRYTLVAAGNATFRIDRMSGAVLYCDAVLCRQLPFAAIVPTAPKAPAPNGTGT